MGVDAEAYMAGAIPTLSRGGSWLPSQGSNGNSLPPSQYHSAYGSSPVSAFPQTPPSHVGSPAGSPVIANHLPFPRSPWAGSSPGPESVYSARSRTSSHKDLAGAASIHGLKRENVLGPVKHNGWLKSPSEASGSVGGSVYQDPLELPHPSSRSVTPSHLRLHHPALGSDMASQRHEVAIPIASPYHRLSAQTAHINQPSPYRRVAELLPSPPQAQESQSSPDRPGLSRRHSHNPLYAPKPKKTHQEDLFRSAQLNNRLARLSIQAGDPSAPRPETALNSPTSPPGGDAGTLASRPSMSRRHSSSHRSTSSSFSGGSSSRRQIEREHRARHLSTPHSSPLVPQPAAATVHSVTSSKSAGRSAMPVTKITHSNSMSTSSQAFPRSVTSIEGSCRSAPHSPLAAAHSRAFSVSGESAKISVGYVSPLDDEQYDPYEPHPAAPPINRSERGLNASQAGSSHAGETTIPNSGPPRAQKEYVPPGFAKPTRNVAWNREGPAMKTHGIAWTREGDPEQLPTAPKGPRFIVARPPRQDSVQSGSWWETGGGDTRFDPQF